MRIINDVAGEVQAEVDRLEGAGVNKIVLISHLQDVDATAAGVTRRLNTPLVDREVEIFGVLVDGTDMAVVQVTVSRVP